MALLLLGITACSAGTITHVYESFDSLDSISGLGAKWSTGGPVFLNTTAAFNFKGLGLGSMPAGCATNLVPWVSLKLNLDTIPYAGFPTYLSFMARAYDPYGSARFVAMLFDDQNHMQDVDLSWQMTSGRWGWRAVTADVQRFVWQQNVRLHVHAQFANATECRRSFLHLDEFRGECSFLWFP